MTRTTVSIDDRYQGFPGIALGGISGGTLARRIGPEVEVVFRRPIETGTTLSVVERDDAVELRDDEVAATAKSTSIDVDVPDPVALAEAEDASRSYLGHHEHPYPSCFTCGTDRAEGDGLRIFAGPVGTGPLVASPWTPHPNHAEADGTLPIEHVWAAVDCPSIWAVMEDADGDSGAHVVTGRLAVRHEGPIRPGEPHVVVAWPMERQSGARPAGAVVFDVDGTVKAVARHTLVVTDWGVPLDLSRPVDG